MCKEACDRRRKRRDAGLVLDKENEAKCRAPLKIHTVRGASLYERCVRACGTYV